MAERVFQLIANGIQAQSDKPSKVKGVAATLAK